MTVRGRAWIVGLLALTLVLVAWSLLPWEWSLIDDPGLVLSVRSAIDDHGAVLGPLVHIWRMVETDLSWGLFRPAYWIYPSLVYALPIGPAHAVRLLLLIVAVAGPVVAVRRSGAGWPLVWASLFIVGTSSSVLVRGLFNVSLQELSGAAFVGLGLMAVSPRLRIAAWLVAAWFKAPFAWLLVGEAVALWRRGERRPAAVSGGLAAVTLALGFIFSRNGTYTAGYTDGMIGRAIANLPDLATPTLLLVAIGWLWWLLLTRSGLGWTTWSLPIAVGAAGYTIQVLPWSLAGHYPGPIFYLMGVLAVSTLRDAGMIGRGRLIAAVVGVGVIAILSVSAAFRSGWSLNLTLLGISECVVRETSGTVALSPEIGPEGVVRIPQNIELRSPEWGGEFTVPGDGGTSMLNSGADLLVVTRPVDAALTGATDVVCDLPYAQVLRPVEQ